nr:phospholipid carrier-dependent glycosyltransferase [Variibacter gotjawalensis]
MASHAGSGADSRSGVNALLWMLGAVLLVRLASLGAYPLFDNTEGRYALIGRLMIESGDWITPYVSAGVPFWGKPPLSFWATAISYSIFGVSEFAARLPVFLFTVGTAWLVFVMARTRGDRSLAALAAAIFCTSALPFYLAGGVMTDPALMFSVTVMMAGFWIAIETRSRAWGYVFFLGVALTMLAKGPVGIVIAGIAIGGYVLVTNRWVECWRNLPWISGTLLALALTAPWYIAAEMRTPGFLRYFIIGEHFDRFLIKDWTGDKYGAPRTRGYGTVWLFLLAAALPWCATALSILIAPAWRQRLFGTAFPRSWLLYLVFWIIATPLLFTPAKAVLWPYVAMSMPGFALLAAEMIERSALPKIFVKLGIFVVPVCGLAALVAMRADPAISYVNTQKGIVAVFQQRSDANAKLTYYPAVPFSAEFYMPGRNVSPPGPNELAQLASGQFAAMLRGWFARLPAATRERFEIISEMNGSVLLRVR